MLATVVSVSLAQAWTAAASASATGEHLFTAVAHDEPVEAAEGSALPGEGKDVSGGALTGRLSGGQIAPPT